MGCDIESREQDGYDAAIEYIGNHEDPILAAKLAWDSPYTVPGGELFAYASPNRRVWSGVIGGKRCGCLTQIRSRQYPAFTTEVTNLIRQDERIPADFDDFLDKHSLSDGSLDVRKLDSFLDTLEVFAEQQRFIDKEYKRPAPRRCGVR